MYVHIWKLHQKIQHETPRIHWNIPAETNNIEASLLQTPSNDTHIRTKTIMKARAGVLLMSADQIYEVTSSDSALDWWPLYIRFDIVRFLKLITSIIYKHETTAVQIFFYKLQPLAFALTRLVLKKLMASKFSTLNNYEWYKF